jgi:phage shock protein PspC (stress-responsive transcriptional regulator)
MRRPRLGRAADDRLVCGVCASVARGLGVSELLVRVACAAVLLITGGIGAIAYVALALLMPAEPGPVAPWWEPDRWDPGAGARGPARGGDVRSRDPDGDSATERPDPGGVDGRRRAGVARRDEGEVRLVA